MNCNDRKYRNELSTPMRPVRPSLDLWKSPVEEIVAARNKYAEEERTYTEGLRKFNERVEEIHADFKRDALEDLGLTDHPKADLAWELAVDSTSGGDLSDAYWFLVRLAPLMLP